MNRAWGALLIAIGVAAGLVGCDAVTQGGPRIVATTNILGDVAQNVVGDAVEVVTLMPPGADPHSFEISAQEAAMLRDADLIISNGLGLEEGVQHHVDAAVEDGVPTFVAGDHVSVLEFATDDASGPDPHFWTDPARVTELLGPLADAIAEHVPGVDAVALAESAEVYAAQVAELDADLEAAFAALPSERRRLVTNHHVFGYLAERYDFEVIGAVLPSGTTLAAPSASDLEELASAIRDAGVPAIFADSSQPARVAEVLAEEAGVEVEIVSLFTESLSGAGEGAETYLEMMRTNGERIASALR
ncbi:zinc/manganese transport system substrate-binding protein [Diaminobutyricimonas aerilata]|uniref:Zinc/manganese transport system substrate-binding protein n=1 Tax=Diaminobutyricimonas aerilata TaxID=1162967 RepID=A0A2M9CF52_9MICO|nr:zinc ABC transporter substrate-binding protein AztC [Diaminobutyricimonas aerilata]PJJ70554.1 zinc/manganese transport system substrate-binding protein [Diaminobutyricimonas aerilata]